MFRDERQSRRQLRHRRNVGTTKNVSITASFYIIHLDINFLKILLR